MPIYILQKNKYKPNYNSFGRVLLPECILPEEYLGHNLDEHCLGDTGAMVPYPPCWGNIEPGTTLLGTSS